MKIYSWNVNSLRSCEEKFLQFIAEYQPDIIGLQELRAHPDQLSFFLKTISGYKFLFNDSGRPGYAGTAMYYKESLPVEKVTARLGNEILDKEGRVIYIQVGDLHFYNFYTPNGNANEQRLKYKMQYYDEILRIAKESLEKGLKVIIGGDLNVAHTSKDLFREYPHISGYLPKERKWFDDMLKAEFVDSFRMFEKQAGFYSWWNLRDPKRIQNQGWRFDYMLVSKALTPFIKSAGISKEVYGSDHCPVWVEVASG